MHYLDRRLGLEELNVTAQDELDWFGHYLEEGLYFKEVRDGLIPGLIVGTYTEPLDAYYSWLSGIRKGEAEKPRQKMPLVIRELVERLERAGPDGFIPAIGLLLEGGTDERQATARLIRDRRERAAKVGFAAGRLGFETGELIVFVAGEQGPPGGFRRYVEATKYLGKRGDTIGIWERAPGGPLELHAAYGTWVENAEAAAEAREVMGRIKERPMPVRPPTKHGRRRPS